MSYLLKPSSVDVSTLTPIENDKLTFADAISALMGGQTVVVTGYEVTENKDVYIKLDFAKPKPVTVETYTSPSKSETYWAPCAIPLNVFSLKTVFKYNEDTAEFDTIYRPNDVIRYQDTAGRNVAGVVSKLYKDSQGKIYIQFTDKPDIYLLQQSGQGMYGEDTGGRKPFIPVADTTRDGSSVIVSDNRDKVRVLM